MRKAIKNLKAWLRNKYVRLIVAAIAAYYTFGLDTAAYAGTTTTVTVAGVQITTATVIVGTSITTTSGIIAGAAAGFIGGAITGGNLKSALTGAVTGGIFGDIGAYYGNTYSVQSVIAESLAGGASSKLNGGSFLEGFGTSFGFSALT